MTRISARTTKILAATVLLGGALAGVNCSKGPNSGTGDGLVRLALTSAGLTVTSVQYQIVHSDGSAFAPPIAGMINTSDKNSTASVLQSVPASTGDIAKMQATATDGLGNMLSCTGQSMGFTVIAGQQVGVTVNLICGGSQVATGSGSAIVNGTVIAGDNCPVLQTWMAAPLQTSAPTGTINLSGMATDADMGETLTFAWTATAGSFAPASTPGVASGTASSTVYTCTTVGMQTLTLTVTDNHKEVTDPNSVDCPVSVTFPINCANTVFCGNGVVDPGTNEQCDPPMPGFCSPTCQKLAPVCGDGIVEAGEQCDDGAKNGTDGICTTMCTFQPAVCGDGIIEAGEACDPPNWDPSTKTGTCNTTKCCLAGTCQFGTFDQNPVCQTCEQTVYPVGNPARAKCAATVESSGQVAGAFGCDSFTSATDVANCKALRTCIITSKCGATMNALYTSGDPTPCFCGANNDPTTCASNTSTAVGPCLAQYTAITAASNVPGLFTSATSPIGIANNLIKCDYAASCACGQ
jgi:cysteine-rich repeat protein